VTPPFGIFTRLKRLLQSKAAGGRRREAQGSPAIDTLRSQLRQNPGNNRLRIKLADALLVEKLQQDAITEYMAAAHSYVAQGFAPMAIAVFKKIVKLDEKHLEANLNLARIYQRENLLADAVSYYQNVFHHYYDTGQRQEAFDILEKILDIAPDKQQFRRRMRELFPEFQEAEKSTYSDLLITSRPPTGDDLAVGTGDGDFFDLGAELSAEVADDISTFSAPGVEPAAHTGETTDNDIGVEKVFAVLKQTMREGATAENADDIDQLKFHYNLAVAYRKLGMYDQAIEESQISLDAPAYRRQLLLLRGQVFRELGNLKESLSQLQQGIRERGLNRKDFLALKYELGLTLLELNDVSRAQEAFREVYSIDPEFQEVATYIAKLDAGAEMIS
jgi:tetratricopeptide (TPR) repeat protein